MPSAALASRYEALFRGGSLSELALSVKKQEKEDAEEEAKEEEAKGEEEEGLGVEEEQDDRRARRAEASRRRFESARGPLAKAAAAIAELRRAVEEGKKKKKTEKKEEAEESGLFFCAAGEGESRGGDAASAVAAELATLLSAAYAASASSSSSSSSSPSSSSERSQRPLLLLRLLPPLPLVAELVLPWAPPEVAVSIALNADGGALAVIASALARAASSSSPSSATSPPPPSAASPAAAAALKGIAAASPSAADAVLEACLSVRACPVASGALEIAAAAGGGARAAALARAATVRAAAFASDDGGPGGLPSPAAAWLAAALSAKTAESDAFIAALEADALSRGGRRGGGGRGRNERPWSRNDSDGVAASARLLAAGAPPSRAAASAWARRLAGLPFELPLGAPTRLAAAAMLLLASPALEAKARSAAFARILSMGNDGGDDSSPSSCSSSAAAAAAAASSTWLSVLLLARAWGPLADGLRRRALGSSAVRFSDAALAAAAADAAAAMSARKKNGDLSSSVASSSSPLAVAAEAASRVPPTRGLAAPSTMASLLFPGSDDSLAADAVAISINALASSSSATATTTATTAATAAEKAAKEKLLSSLAESVARHVSCAGAPLHPSLVALVEAAAAAGLGMPNLRKCVSGSAVAAALRAAAGGEGSAPGAGAAVLASYHSLLTSAASPSWPSPAEELPLLRLAPAVANRGSRGGGDGGNREEEGGGGAFGRVRARWLSLADAVSPGAMPACLGISDREFPAVAPAFSLSFPEGFGEGEGEGESGPALATARLCAAAAEVATAAAASNAEEDDDGDGSPSSSPLAAASLRLLSAVDAASRCLLARRDCPAAVSEALALVCGGGSGNSSSSLPPALARAARARVLRACGCALPASPAGGAHKRKRGGGRDGGDSSGSSSLLDAAAADAAALAAAPLLAFAPSPRVWESPVAAEACLSAAVAVLSDARHAMRTMASALRKGGSEREERRQQQQQQQQPQLRGGASSSSRSLAPRNASTPPSRPSPASFIPSRGPPLDAALASVDGAALVALGEALAVVLRRAAEEEEGEEEEDPADSDDDDGDDGLSASGSCCPVAASLCLAIHAITLDSPHAPSLAAKLGGWSAPVARLLVAAVPSLHVAADFAGQLALAPKTGGVGGALSTELAARWPTPATLAGCLAALARGRAAADAGDAEAVAAVLAGAGKAAAVLPGLAGGVAALAQAAANAANAAAAAADGGGFNRDDKDGGGDNGDERQRLSGAAERALADLATARLGHGVLPTARAAKT